MHQRFIPRTGGLVIAIAFFLPVLGSAFTGVGVDLYETRAIFGLLAGAFMVFFMGLYDDFYGLRARYKLLGQLLAASIAFYAGFRIEVVSLPFEAQLEMGAFAFPITVFWIVGVVNAFNLIDGLDGLAGGIGFLVLLLSFALGLLSHQILMCLCFAALGGALLGFLHHNFAPASIFLGDSGSMLVGFVLATGTLHAGTKSPATVALLTPIVAMGIPIMDTLFSMLRRYLQRQPMFAPDRGHIHHRLVDLGFGHRQAVFVLYLLTILLIISALLLRMSRGWEVGMGLLGVAVAVVVLTRTIGVARWIGKRATEHQEGYSLHMNLLREHLPPLLERAKAVASLPELQSFLQDLLIPLDIQRLEFTLNRPNEPLRWSLRNPQYASDHRKNIVTAPYAFANPEGSICFWWSSDRVRISPQTQMLLQVLVDGIAAQLPRIQGHAPNRPFLVQVP
jgi:UDP-GlcNAc:undecaprenyl-phosphate GlcNAc-1-phosphate transferase